MKSDPQKDNQLPNFLQEIMNKDIDPQDKAKIQQSLEQLKSNPKMSPVFSLIGGLTGIPLNKIIESIGKNIQASKTSTSTKQESSDIMFGSIIYSAGNPTSDPNSVPRQSLSSPTAHSAQTKNEIPQEVMQQLPSSIRTTLLSSGKYSSMGQEKPILKNSLDLRGILLILAFLGLIVWSAYGYFG